MRHNMKSIRRVMAALLVLVVMAAFVVIPASAAYWSNVYVGQGQYVSFSTSSSTYFPISANTYVDHDITFARDVLSTVKAGYFKQYTNYPSYVAKMSGNGSKTMSALYTISSAGNYKFYVYNGSSDGLTVSNMTVIY